MSALETELGTFDVETLERASDVIQEAFSAQDCPTAVSVTGALWFFVQTLRYNGYGAERLRAMLEQAVELARAVDAERAVDLDAAPVASDDLVEQVVVGPPRERKKVSLRVVGWQLADGTTIRVDDVEKGKDQS